MRGEITDRRRISVKERENICAKGWSIESRDNLITLWYTNSRI